MLLPGNRTLSYMPAFAERGTPDGWIPLGLPDPEWGQCLVAVVRAHVGESAPASVAHGGRRYETGIVHQDRDECDITIESYDAGIGDYLANTARLPESLRRFLDRFAAALVTGGHVLELGSGPGWDADYLQSRGLRVERSDAAPAFVEWLRVRGHEARILDARDVDYGGPYDGVLADAVLLHLSRSQAEQALRTARKATRPGGVLGITLKEGDGAAWSTAKLGRPRHFTYWREAELDAVLSRSGWRTGTIERVAGRGEPWLFALASRHVDDGFGSRGVEQGRVESHVGEMARDL
jgi:SAM-dependent methyltransferase